MHAAATETLKAPRRNRTDRARRNSVSVAGLVSVSQDEAALAWAGSRTRPSASDVLGFPAVAGAL